MESILEEIALHQKIIARLRAKLASEPKAQWEELREEILERIKEIDKITPWSEHEPSWWLEMREVESILT